MICSLNALEEGTMVSVADQVFWCQCFILQSVLWACGGHWFSMLPLPDKSPTSIVLSNTHGCTGSAYREAFAPRDIERFCSQRLKHARCHETRFISSEHRLWIDQEHTANRVRPNLFGWGLLRLPVKPPGSRVVHGSPCHSHGRSHSRTAHRLDTSHNQL